uniref:Uncharacterized protein n=1 Tax=viral metagenome TaxID=1070528 RepID=A0A6C0J922_9ZZZZ
MSNDFLKDNMDLIKSFLYNSDIKNYVLDPLTCIVRCAILSFKPIGTKLSINQNKITFIDPNILQGVIRWSYGDKREDLHNIYKPIIKSTKWYKVDNPDILNIFILAKKGLEKLKQSYEENSIITHSLSLYINILDLYINSKNNDINSKNNDINSKNNLDDEEDNKIYSDLKLLWSDSQISIVNNILKQMEIDSVNRIDWFQAIDIILKSKEKNVYEIIKKNTTTLQ